MKKILVMALALLLILSTASGAFALNYQQHLANEATFETLEEAHANGPAALEALTGRKYIPDPALDSYPVGTTFVYRSAGMYTCLSAAYRMNTNFLVYANESFATKEDAKAYLDKLGLIALVDKACGSIVLVTPVDQEAGFGSADQYAYFQLQSAMCNLGFSEKKDDVSYYYADNTYFGGLTYRYVIGIEDGATFINDYIAGELDDISRVAGLFLYGGKMADISKVAGLVPAYLVNVPEKVVDKYIAANETDAYSEQNGIQKYFNQSRTQQAVCVTTAESLSAELLSDAYYDFLVDAMRVPVLKSGQNNANSLYRNYNFNQAPYTLSKRVAIIDGRTEDGIIVIEKVSDQFASITQENGEYLQTWYEFLPEEVLNNTAPEHSVPLWLANHGGGDDPVQFVDEIGLLELASNERLAIVAAENQSLSTENRCASLPALVEYMLATYPALDPSRVYTTGYSMGGGCTLNAVAGNPKLFAAAVPMAAVTYRANEEQTETFKSVDIPIMFLTSTYDYFYDTTTFEMRISRMCEYPVNINEYLSHNEMEQIAEYDFKTYPLAGFAADSYRRIVLNNEYTNHTWLINNDAGVPMVGLTVTEFLPHGLYPEYAKLAWDFVKHYSRNTETGEVIYNPYAK